MNSYGRDSGIVGGYQNRPRRFDSRDANHGGIMRKEDAGFRKKE